MMFLSPHHRSIAAPGDTIIRDGLITRWPMDEGSGNTLFDDQGSNNAALNGIVAEDWVAGFQGGSAIDFSHNSKWGENSTIDLSGVTDATFMVRIKTTTTRSNAIFLNHRDANDGNYISQFILRDASSIRFYYRVTGQATFLAMTGITYADDIWHTVMFTMENGSLINGYWDGALHPNSKTVPGGFINQVTPQVILGLGLPGSGISPLCTLDDYRYYNRKISDVEALQIHQGNG